MDNESLVLNLRRRLLIERIVFAVVILTVLVCWTFSHFRDSKSLILVDGKPIVCVPSKQDATDILSRIKLKTGYNPSEIQFKQDVRVERAPRNANPMSRHKAYRAVERVVSPVVAKWAIIADGIPIVAIPSKKIAGEVLDAAKYRYGRLVKNLSEEPQFKENVTVDIAAVDPAIYKKTVDEAVKFIFDESTPVTKDAVYEVQKGDLAGSISARYGLKLAELAALNQGRNLDHLQIGDKLRIKTSGNAGPRLTVIVRDQGERTESLPAPVQQVSSTQLYTGKTFVLSRGSAGKRKVTVENIYENGHKTGTEVIDEQILKEPVPRRIAVGIKAR